MGQAKLISNKMCAKCGLRPRHIYPSGQASRCSECLREGNHEAYLRLRRGEKTRSRAPREGVGAANLPCRRCGQNPRYHFPGGRTSAYCRHCRQIVERESRQARAQGAEFTPTSEPAAATPPSEAGAASAGVPSDEALFGILTEMVLFVNRSRGAIANGAPIDRLNIAVDVNGVRLSMTTEPAN